jgi:hypothetical protein
MIEALACGTPVVGTPCGSAPELVTEGVTGFLASSEAGLVDAIGRVAALERARCRADAERRFSAERMVAEHVALYERVRATTTHASVVPLATRPGRSPQPGRDARTPHRRTRRQNDTVSSARGGDHGDQKVIGRGMDRR